jgi:hypothetical protein
MVTRGYFEELHSARSAIEIRWHNRTYIDSINHLLAFVHVIHCIVRDEAAVESDQQFLLRTEQSSDAAPGCLFLLPLYFRLPTSCPFETIFV